MTEVAAALIWQGNRFLICRRPDNKARAMLWEFVGGKLEAGESGAEALRREVKEELDIEISVGDIFAEVIHEYPDITVHLTLYNAAIINGAPRMLEHSAMAWVTPDEAVDYEFCPADDEIIAMLIGTDRMTD
ncbi:MAG: (deoxy)nucleoside triphosphate pyrophosphohydrolase [Eubacteriaceae bacterium]|nr:(deoxy)nucleoside triphosphate pyrophosphohydrolase [Eubacteriaceae bacterium]